MVQPNNEPLKNEDKFTELTTLEPERDDIILEGEEGSEYKSLGEAEEQNQNVPDMQFALKRLLPKSKWDVINRHAEMAMVARMDDETFLDWLHLTVIAIVEDWGEEDGVPPVQEIINTCYFFGSIGRKGMGRADVIEVTGAQKEAEELHSVSEELRGFAR